MIKVDDDLNMRDKKNQRFNLYFWWKKKVLSVEKKKMSSENHDDFNTLEVH